MRWFHEIDGGRIKFYPCANVAYCPICEGIWTYLESWWEVGSPLAAHNCKWTSFSELPEDLQTAALAEML